MQITRVFVCFITTKSEEVILIQIHLVEKNIIKKYNKDFLCVVYFTFYIFCIIVLIIWPIALVLQKQANVSLGCFLLFSYKETNSFILICHYSYIVHCKHFIHFYIHSFTYSFIQNQTCKTACPRLTTFISWLLNQPPPVPLNYSPLKK